MRNTVNRGRKNPLKVMEGIHDFLSHRGLQRAGTTRKDSYSIKNEVIPKKRERSTELKEG